MDQVQQTREEIVITRHGKSPQPIFGCLAGKVQINGDIIAGDIIAPLDVAWNA